MTSSVFRFRIPNWSRQPKRLDLSFVVVAYDMERELPRTLQSLTRTYQQGSESVDYEVIVIDNGSPAPFGEAAVRAYGENFRYVYLRDPPSSPAFALNYGVRQAKGRIVCLMIDGARIATPGLVRWSMAAFRAFRDPTVVVSGWHLGPDLQNRSVTQGYDQRTEDALLDKIGFPDDGYRLFEIAVLAGSCRGGWFLPWAESNAAFIRRDSYLDLGGYDERFDLPGGGLVNLDFYRRAVLRPQSELVVLLGEGVFHQIHGGVATNAGEASLARKLEQWRAQYRHLRGVDFTIPEKRPVYLGKLKAPVLPSLAVSARKALEAGYPWRED